MINSSNQQENAEDNEYLSRLLMHLDEYQTRFPNEVTANISRESGMNCTDNNVIKLITILTEKFISDVVSGCKSNSNGESSLQLENVKRVISKHGITSHRPEFLVEDFKDEGSGLHNNFMNSLFDEGN